MARVLAVGFAADVVGGLDGQDTVDIIEEPDLVERRHVRQQLARFPFVGELLTAEYVESRAYRDVALAAARSHWDAVFPVVEYAVPAAADLAEEFGLPGATRAAAGCFRDKRLLRTATMRAGLPTPRWAAVADAAALRAFVDGCDGDVVLKPADRAASLGVQILAPGADLDAAWAAVTDDASDPLLPSRGLPRGFLVEERLSGPEFSVECLVARGSILFGNVTRKALFPGRSPVERGHDVPAGADPDLEQALLDTTRAVIEATGLDTAVLHAEWIVTEAAPVLVECAARFPGDKIALLLEQAYGLRLGPALVRLLAGAPPGELPQAPRQAASIRFITAEPGEVVAIEGVDAALDLPNVLDVLTVPIGHQVRQLRSSFDRVGYVVAVGETPAHSATTAERASEALKVVTRPAG